MGETHHKQSIMVATVSALRLRRTVSVGTHIVIAAVALQPHLAAAQSYPSKPIRVIIAVPAGGAPDLVTRMIAPGMSNLLGQQLVIDNRGGAGGLIGAELAAKAQPDGYTLFVSNPGPLVILPHLQRQAAYDAFRDFAPIGLISLGHSLLVTPPSRPYKTVGELITYARAQPGKLDYASAGNGSVIHLAMELFKSMAGVNITHVPYKGSPQGLTDVLGGHVALTFSTIPPVLQHIKLERLRLLGIASAKRSPQLPNVPTICEAGVPGYEISTWVGLLAPAKTPTQIIARLNEAMVKVVRMPESKTQFESQGADPVGGSAKEFAALMRSESAKYSRAVKVSGLKAD